MDDATASGPSPFETPKVIDAPPAPLLSAWVSGIGMVLCIYGILLVGLEVVLLLSWEEFTDSLTAVAVVTPLATTTLVSGWRLAAGRSAGHWLWGFGFLHVLGAAVLLFGLVLV